MEPAFITVGTVAGCCWLCGGCYAVRSASASTRVRPISKHFEAKYAESTEETTAETPYSFNTQLELVAIVLASVVATAGSFSYAFPWSTDDSLQPALPCSIVMFFQCLIDPVDAITTHAAGWQRGASRGLGSACAAAWCGTACFASALLWCAIRKRRAAAPGTSYFYSVLTPY